MPNRANGAYNGPLRIKIIIYKSQEYTERKATMAGHSKWANIKHRKAGQDAKRGKIFTKVLREITVAVKTSGPDAASNPALRTAIDKALGANMRRDTIDTAIKKASGALEGANYENVRYEGYGPGGVAVIVDCLTDNRNRTVGEVRHGFRQSRRQFGYGWFRGLFIQQARHI